MLRTAGLEVLIEDVSAAASPGWIFFLLFSLVVPDKMIDWDQGTKCPALPQQMIWPLLADLGQKEINISPLKSIRGELGQWLSEATLSSHCNIKPDTYST